MHVMPLGPETMIRALRGLGVERMLDGEEVEAYPRDSKERWLVRNLGCCQSGSGGIVVDSSYLWSRLLVASELQKKATFDPHFVRPHEIVRVDS